MQNTDESINATGGYPGIQNQQSSLASVFPLWLADPKSGLPSTLRKTF